MQEAVDSLIAHARAYVTLEEVNLGYDVRVVLSVLSWRQNGRMTLQRSLRKTDEDTKEIIRSLIVSTALAVEADSREALRVGERVAQPVQTSTIAGSFAFAIAGLAGTISVPIALTFGLVTLVIAIYTSRVRSQMARKESLLKTKADRIKALL